MCMDSVTTVDKGKLPKRGGWGWKSFHYINGKLNGSYRGKGQRPIGKWINEKDFRDFDGIDHIHSFGGRWYPIGWHIWKDRFSEVYRRNGARIVRFRKPVAAGRQYNGKVIIAKEMLILSKRESLKWLDRRKKIV